MDCEEHAHVIATLRAELKVQAALAGSEGAEVTELRAQLALKEESLASLFSATQQFESEVPTTARVLGSVARDYSIWQQPGSMSGPWSDRAASWDVLLLGQLVIVVFLLFAC